MRDSKCVFQAYCVFFMQVYMGSQALVQTENSKFLAHLTHIEHQVMAWNESQDIQ